MPIDVRHCVVEEYVAPERASTKDERPVCNRCNQEEKRQTNAVGISNFGMSCIRGEIFRVCSNNTFAWDELNSACPKADCSIISESTELVLRMSAADFHSAGLTHQLLRTDGLVIQRVRKCIKLSGRGPILVKKKFLFLLDGRLSACICILTDVVT